MSNNYFEIMQHVNNHHCHVKRHYHGYQVIFTALLGSQNYELANENSDYDTISLILPPFKDFISGASMVSNELALNDGKCIVKDFRHAIQLLRKTSPNSVEYFSSPYITYNFIYTTTLEAYLNNDLSLFYLTHNQYKHMKDAISGMCHQLHGRNMSAGKRYSHALRLLELYKNFIKPYNKDEYNLFKWNESMNLAAAKNAKFTPVTNYENYYNRETEHIANYIYNAKLEDPNIPSIEAMSQEYIDDFLNDIINTYLQLKGYRRYDYETEAYL